jgi:hypothetical protein
MSETLVLEQIIQVAWTTDFPLYECCFELIISPILPQSFGSVLIPDTALECTLARPKCVVITE